MQKKFRADISDFSWFNLNNYKFIDDLTVSELIEELEQRIIAFCDLEEAKKKSNTDTPEAKLPEHFDIPLIEMPDLDNELDAYPELDLLAYEEVIKFIRILKGEPNLSKDSSMDTELRYQFEKITPPSVLIRSLPLEDECVYPLNFIELYTLDREARLLGAYDHDEQGKLIIREPKYSCASVNGNISNTRGLFHASLDLENATDEQILIGLRHLLPLWREKLAIPEPKTDNESNKYVSKQELNDIKSIYKYRILPMLDVLLWSKAINKELTNSLILMLIFPDDLINVDTQIIKDTRRPFALKTIQDDFIRSLSFFLKKDGELGSSKVSDLMRR